MWPTAHARHRDSDYEMYAVYASASTSRLWCAMLVLAAAGPCLADAPASSVRHPRAHASADADHGSVGDRGWATDAALEAAVGAAGFSGCSIRQWTDDVRGTTADDSSTHGAGSNGAHGRPDDALLSEPLVIASTSSPPWASPADSGMWAKTVFLKAHGGAQARVRLPAGQRQSGLLFRETTVARFANDITLHGGAGTEPGLLLGRAPRSLIDATAGLPSPSVLDRANLTAAVLSLGGAGVGMPFHNHGAVADGARSSLPARRHHHAHCHPSLASHLAKSFLHQPPDPSQQPLLYTYTSKCLH